MFLIKHLEQFMGLMMDNEVNFKHLKQRSSHRKTLVFHPKQLRKKSKFGSLEDKATFCSCFNKGNLHLCISFQSEETFHWSVSRKHAGSSSEKCLTACWICPQAAKFESSGLSQQSLYFPETSSGVISR